MNRAQHLTVGSRKSELTGAYGPLCRGVSVGRARPAPFSRLHQARPCMTMMCVEGHLEKKERVEYTQDGQHENEYRGGPGTATIEPSPD